MKTLFAVLGLACLCVLAGCSTPNIYDVKTDRSLFLNTHRGDKVFVDVQNTSSLQSVDLAPQIRKELEARGYQVVGSPADADAVLRANVRYSGLMEEALKKENILGGAAAGGVIGGLGGATIGHGHATAGGALIGLLAGAGIGYWAERRDVKNTFVTVVDLQVLDKRTNHTAETNVYARIREHELTMETAATRVMPDVAAQIAGQFTNWAAQPAGL